MTATEQNETTPNSRLIIKKLVLINFKSYAGTIEVGPFHKSFTSIVGPNGSGKSNVIDALLFVFGFKAKKMRHEKLSGLIHSSQKHSDLEYCRVEVHFHKIIDLENDSYEVIPDSDLIIARQANKNNKSQYEMNGKVSNYTEVTLLLKQMGIDLEHKRFLILQGEVESIAQMKPKAMTEHEDGLLEYLEDIIGTSRYKPLIDDAFAKVEKLNEERAEKLNRVKLVENDLKAMQGQKEEAETYLRKENELNHLKNQLYQFYIHHHGKKVDDFQNELNELKQQLSNVEDLLKENTENIKGYEKENEKNQKEYKELKMQEEMSKKDFGKFEREFIQLEERKKHLKQKKKKLEKQLEKEKMNVTECEQWLKNHGKDLERKNDEINQLNEKLGKSQKELEKIREQLQKKTQKVQQKLDQKKEELMPWTEKINDIQAQIQMKQSQLDLIEEKAEQGSKSAAEIETKLQESDETISDLKQKQKYVEKELNERQKLQLKKNKEALQLKEKEEELKLEIIETCQQMEAIKSQLEAASSRDQLSKVLWEEKKQGRLPGLFGRLNELATINDRYDVAISSAFSEGLKMIVVDTVQTAERALKILKSRQMGRASFIVLERTPEIRPLTDVPENVDRLIDLLKPKEERFRKAFYYLIRDTLIASDLEQANRIAFGKRRFKVVTLDGKVIDQSGTMTGGGQKISRGALSKQLIDDVTEEDFERLQQKSTQLEEELKEVKDSLKDVEKEVKELEIEVPKLQLEMEQLTMDLEATQEVKKSLTERLEELKSQDQVDDKADLTKMEQLRKEIKKLEKEEQKLNQDSQEIQNEIQKYQNQILEMGGNELRRQNIRNKDLEDQIQIIHETSAKIESQQKQQEKLFHKSQSAYEKCMKESKEVEEEIALVEEQIERHQSRVQNFQESSSQIQKLAEEKKEKMEVIKNQLDERMSVINELKKEKMELESQLNDLQKNNSDTKKSVQHYKLLISELSLSPIDGEAEEVLKQYDEEELEQIDNKKMENKLNSLDNQLNEMKPNLSILEEYRQRMQDHQGKAKDLEDVTKQRDNEKQIYDDLRKKRLDEFMKGFSIISQKLKEMYQMITLGGNAELELVDSLDPFSEGVLFSVMPPRKSWKNISNLSGGEKTLSSLALVFALHHYKPTPLYVMDEIDAALDFRNVSIIANYIRERTRNAQFVIISLRNNMFELADRLVGIYKIQDCTKSIAINPAQVQVGN